MQRVGCMKTICICIVLKTVVFLHRLLRERARARGDLRKTQWLIGDGGTPNVSKDEGRERLCAPLFFFCLIN